MKKILKQQKRKREYEPLPCDKETAYFLCLLGGWAGVHKFYEGKTALGVLYLFTFGLFGAGWIFDLIAILSKKEDTYYT